MADPERERTPDVASSLSLLRRFWDIAREHKRWWTIGLSVIPVVAAVTAVRPLLVKEAVDVAIPARDGAAIQQLALLFLAAVLVEFVSMALQVYALQRAGPGGTGRFVPLVYF